MPELPEIETVKLQLRRVLVGQTLRDIIILNKKTVQSEIGTLTGKSVQDITRLGKVLLISFGNNLKLGFHFKMTGQLIYDDGEARIGGGHPSNDFINALPSKHTKVVFVFERGKLFFNDQRTFGWIAINPKFVDKLGPELFDITANQFFDRVIRFKNKPIKQVIMDQEVIAGVGNIYANDALWEAKIDPRRVIKNMTFGELNVLFRKIKLVLDEGIMCGGATAANYVNLHGLGGKYQEHFRTYAQTGKPCKRCGATIVKTIIAGRGTFYCPECQK